MHDPNKTLWWENVKFYLNDLRIYKLAHILYEHISHRIKEINTSASAIDFSHPDNSNYQQIEIFLKFVIVESMEHYKEHMRLHEYQLAQQSITQTSLVCVELARRYRIKGSFKEAQDVLEGALSLDPNSAAVYQELGELYLTQGKCPEAVKYFQIVLTLDPKNNDILPELARAYHQEHRSEAFFVYAKYLKMNPQNYWDLIEFAKWLREYKQYDLAQAYLSHAIELGVNFGQAYLDMGQILDDQGQYQKEEAFYLKEISLHPQIPHIYQVTGDFYMKQGKEDLARKYFKKAVQQKIAEFYPATFVNYALILNRILRQNIKVIVMQYPVRDISPLKDYLGQRNGVIFVENRQNFKKALSAQSFSYYFKDNFAYDFGHCTRKGNELIAQNLRDVILKKELAVH